MRCMEAYLPNAMGTVLWVSKELTFLKHARPVDLDDARLVLVLLVETHLVCLP